MKLLIPLILSITFAKIGFASVDRDLEKLENLASSGAEFFDALTMNKNLLYSYREDGTIDENITLSKAEIRKLIEEYQAMDDFWDVAKQAQCDSLSLPTVSRGVCLHRHVAITLTAFFKNFQMTKRLLRSTGDAGIEAAKKVSQAVKTATAYVAATCDLAAAIAWGGSGQHLVKTDCLISEVNKASERLQLMRNMLHEPEGPRLSAEQTKSKAYSAGEWQETVSERLRWLDSTEQDLKEAMEEFFFSETSKRAGLAALETSKAVWRKAHTDHCEAYASVIFLDLTQYMRHAGQAKLSCAVEMIEERQVQIYDIVKEYSAATQ